MPTAPSLAVSNDKCYSQTLYEDCKKGAVAQTICSQAGWYGLVDSTSSPYAHQGFVQRGHVAKSCPTCVCAALAAEAGAQAGAPDAPDAAGDGQQAGAPDAPHAAGPSGPPRPVSAREALARQAVCSTFAASASFGAKRAMAAAHSFAAGVMPPGESTLCCT